MVCRWETLMSATQEILKGPYTWLQPWSGTRPAHSGTWGETHPSMPLQPCLQNLILAVEPTMALGLGPRLTQPWSRVSPAHPGTHPVTRQQPSQGLGGSHIDYTPGNKPAVWGPDCGSWSRSMFQCHTTEQGTGGNPIYPGTRQDPCPSKSLVPSSSTSDHTADPAT